MRWWGWGEEDHAPALPAHALGFLAETVGIARNPKPPVALDQVRLPPPAAGEKRLQELRAIVGEEHVRDGHADRVAHADGRGYLDLVRLRSGEPEGAPDAVVLPHSHEEVRAVIELCARTSLAVVPFGGGTSVVGGVEPLTVAVEAGIRPPALERHLAARGLTLGHFPQSYEYVSLGGCAATRSAGQASSGYGAIEKMIMGLRLAAPAGDIALAAVPATAAGPGLRQLLGGSAGSLRGIGQL